MELTPSRVIAHRGASAEAPENTLAAFRRAIDLEVDFIELDVQLTSDGVPVVFHDQELNRTTDTVPNTPLSALTLAELKKLDAGSWFSSRYSGEHIPTLEEVLELNRGSTGLMIELKTCDPCDPLVGTVLSLIRSKQPSDHLLIGSLDRKIVELLCRQVPQRTIGIAEDGGMLEDCLSLGVSKLAVHFSLITASFASHCAAHQIELWAWTVDYPQIAARLFTLGVRGLITNNPRIFRRGFENLSLS